ncbi:methyl-accepting chemotaxis protein [Methanomassiliicoccus luminyensis]|uniref:methyl-accepting chemotaxis protein n=1 Tax=Methanomassiliicoccus luminyensis TaxID=1080712 RepID=UPI00037E6FC9|nr:methyl-accepting chemotaxis protein [Methanomassiliicoccus luminyensis]
MQAEKEKTAVEELIATMPIAAYAADSHWKITMFNEAAEALTGIPVHEAVGLRVRDVFNGAIGKKGCPVFEAIGAGRSVYAENIKFTNNDDETVICTVSAKPLKDKTGKASGSMGFVNVRYEGDDDHLNYLNSLPTPVLAMDKDLRVMFMNASALEMTGRTQDEVKGKPCHEFMRTDHCKGGNCATRRAMAEDRSFVGDAIAHLPSGDTPIRGMVGPLKDKQGNIVGAVEFILDIAKETEITSEVHRLVDETLAGNLKARADPSRFDGNYRSIISGFNETLDAVTSPMLITAEHIEKVAQGDLSQKVEDDFKGDMNLIKNNLNICIDSIRGLVHDVNGLSEAANKGNFTQRVDATNHHGEYRKVVEGVNETLGTVVDKMFWYEQILDSVPFPLSVTDMDMNITYLNQASLDMLKVKKGEMAGKPCHNWNGPICRTKNCGIVRLREGTGRTVSDRDGKALQVDATYIKNAKGESIGHCEVLQDITKAIRQRKYQAAEVERMALNLQNLACGNLVMDLNVANPDQYTQEIHDNFVKIMDNMGQARNAISTLVDDVNTLSKSAVQGKLSSRADASKHQGEYQKVIEGVNDTLDALITPLKVAAAYVDRISKGNIPSKITKEYNGDFNTIKVNLNQCIDAIDALVRDTEMLSKAAIAGQLSTRTDISVHKGDYQTIVKGVNDTMDAVIRPLEDAMRVADSFANGDLTARLEVETQGDFTTFADSLDKIGESLTSLVKEVNHSVDMVSSTSQELASSAEEMNASTEQVSAAIQQISKGAQSQSAQVDETAKAMAEMSTAVIQVVDRTQFATQSAKKGAEAAEKGQAAVESTVNKMQEIQKVVEESAKVIAVLGKRSEEIGQIVDVITNISDQTNLLALNAAIEAARAGDQGRGFAVVAEEVKNLAEDSREAAERIAKMIKEVQQETSKAVEAMGRGTKEAAEGMKIVDQTGKAFQEISSSVAQSSSEMTTIATLMEAQKEGTQKAAKSVDGIASIAEETASAAEESASSTEELTASMEDMTARAQSLSEMAINLKRIAAQFKVDEDEPEEEEEPPRVVYQKKQEKKPPVKEAAKVPVKVREALAKRGIDTSE